MMSSLCSDYLSLYRDSNMTSGTCCNTAAGGHVAQLYCTHWHLHYNCSSVPSCISGVVVPYCMSFTKEIDIFIPDVAS